MFQKNRARSWLIPALCVLGLARVSVAGAQEERPVMRDFMGLCVHTVLFEAEIYTPIARHVRDYHGVNWDLGEETDHVPQWPLARNGVNWDQLYGDWTGRGYEVLVSLMFDATPPAMWSDLEREAHAYGRSFAAYFGASGQGTVSSVEIGNEPTQWDDSQYRALFESAARGVREADPEMRIATCAAQAGPSDTYAKSLDGLAGLESLYDIINVHAYALVEGWPTWRRSYPEDPSIDFLTRLEEIIAWRDGNAPGKEIWITEFGWDATTQSPDPEGDFAQWEDVSDLQQAQYIVRSWLVFSAMDIDRAYLYWFNDEDEPQLHGSSGLTRHGEAKPSFHAVAQLQANLGALRLDRVVRGDVAEAYVYAYVDPADPERECWVAWSPTGADRQQSITLPLDGWQLERGEAMSTEAGAPVEATVEVVGDALQFELNESPTYLWLSRPTGDVGVDAGTDAAGVAPPDSGSGPSDASSPPGDVRISEDAGRPPGTADVGGGDAGGLASAQAPDDGGCGCATGRPSSALSLLLLFGVVVLGISRRRSGRLP